MIAAAMTLWSGLASAATVTLDLPDVERATKDRVRYQCGATEIEVTYINVGANSLAVLKLGERVVVAASVLAASGARYAGQELVWWTKGDDTTLYDLTAGEDAPGTECTVSG